MSSRGEIVVTCDGCGSEVRVESFPPPGWLHFVVKYAHDKFPGEKDLDLCAACANSEKKSGAALHKAARELVKRASGTARSMAVRLP